MAGSTTVVELLAPAAALAQKFVALGREESDYPIVVAMALRIAMRYEQHRMLEWLTAEESQAQADRYAQHLKRALDFVESLELVSLPATPFGPPPGSIVPMPEKKGDA